jgi:hypothetical protein
LIWNSGDVQRTSRPPILPVAPSASRAAAAKLGLPPVPVRVELQRMEVELAPARVAQDVRRGPLVLVDMTELWEDCREPRDVFGANCEVEVVVRARLVSQ